MTPFHTNNDLYFFYSTLLERKTIKYRGSNFCKFLSKLIIGLSFQNDICHCSVIFCASPDLGRKLDFLLFRSYLFLETTFGSGAIEDRIVSLPYLFFAMVGSVIFLSSYNIKKDNMNRGACSRVMTTEKKISLLWHKMSFLLYMKNFKTIFENFTKSSPTNPIF